MKQMERARCWKIHSRRQGWDKCPLCGVPLKWVRLTGGDFCPCDIEPVLFIREDGARLAVAHRRELVEGCRIYDPRRDGAKRPEMGRIPHFYTCPPLRAERREWARNRGRVG